MKTSHSKSSLHIVTLASLLISLIGGAMFVTPAQAAGPFTVNSFIDAVDATLGDGVCETGPGNGVCTLRAAIQEANALAGDDTITVPAGTYTLTILGRDEYAAATGDLNITSNITINGAGAGSTIIQAGTIGYPGVPNGIDRVFAVYGAFTVNISGVTVRNGSGVNVGGGIYNPGTLTITNSTFSGNSTSYEGSGIYNTGTLNITNSAFTLNTSGNGGGIRNDGTATITNSIFSGNSATNYGAGAGISNTGTLTIANSTFSGNSAPDNGGGGGIFNNNSGLTLNITNSTFSGNSAFGGGGIYTNDGTVTITNSTFSGNSATNSGGGIYQSTGTVTLRNTIVANSSSGGNCGGSMITNGGNNIDDGTTCDWGSASGSMSNTPPLLGTLANNGGPTQTFALLPGSSAIDAGNSTYCPTNDQRGVARVGTCDIGAFESGGFTLAITAGNNQITPVNTAFATSLQVTVTSKASPPEPVDGGQVTFTPPASGASASLTGSPATIVGGAASVNASANGTLGGYNVTASANGANSVDFALRNIGTPVITWSNPANIVYGTALSGTQLNATADVPGTFTYSPIAGTVLTVGTHTLHVDFTPTDTTNYSGASKDVSITVTLMYNLFLPLILR